MRTLLSLSILVLSALTACGDDDRPTPDADPGMMMDGDVDSGTDETDSGEDDAGEDDTGIEPDARPDTGPPSCNNEFQDGDESDSDCGGPTCNPCMAGQMCFVSTDCDSAVCISGECQPARCSDGISNGTETGVDCGGGDCPGCPLGSPCPNGSSDCAAGMCVEGFCVPDHCFDETINSGESDVDCGGGECAPCVAGQACNMPEDCVEMTDCIEDFCRTTECADGMMNGDELGIDCGGGTCPGCPDGTMCMMDTDCVSDRCDGDTCSSCSDGMMNGDETDVDCGGSQCRRCFGGESCAAPGDCASGVCTMMECEGGGIFYAETFGSNDGGWTTGGSASSWAFGAPSGEVIASAHTGSMVWVTNPAGDYNSSENSYIESPALDFSTATGDPLMEFFLLYETESCCDEGWIEISIDGGTNWEKLVGDEDSENWYNDESNQWWDDTNETWTQVSVYLAGTAGEDDVRIRVMFSSDGSVQREGFAVDDILIREDVCNNGLQDVGEADVDCGGECDACPDGADCTMGRDCDSGRCDTDTCGSCRDGMQNGDEIQVDCGGTSCALCPGGTPCTDGTICASGMCESNLCTISGPFYEEDFEGGTGDWSAGGTMPSWAHGMPTGETIDSAANGDNAWVTNLAGNYSSSEDSYIESPSFSLEMAGVDPVLSFSLFYTTEGCCDESWVEVSIDGGTSWTKVEDNGGGIGWYNDDTNQWWDGTNDEWTTVSVILTGTAGEADVRLRVRFSSDGSVVREGIGIDDVRVGPAAPDLTIDIAPSDELCSAAKITVTNIGSAPVSFFDLMTNIDGMMNTMQVAAALEPGESWDEEFMVNTSISATVSARGDAEPGNDSATGAAVAPRVLDTRYFEHFDAGDGGWITSGMNSSWEHGEPDDFSTITVSSSDPNAWVTNLGDDYNNDELSYLVSPCFDMSSTTSDPLLSFRYIHDISNSGDGAYVEVTLDGGMTWTKLGTSDTGTNWYNEDVDNHWDSISGVAGMWIRGSHPLVGAAGASQVRIRFVMSSDGSSTDEGFGVDNVAITP